MQTLKIPQERVAVLIGASGCTKKKIEKAMKVKLQVDREGEVDLTSKDPVAEWRSMQIVQAIGRGFSPERAFKLVGEDYYLKIIDLRELLRNEKEIERIKGRIIGEKGRTRLVIEETSSACVCVYGHTVALIGKLDEVALAERAIEKLMEGAMHATVYKMLERGRREMNESRRVLWEEKKKE